LPHLNDNRLHNHLLYHFSTPHRICPHQRGWTYLVHRLCFLSNNLRILHRLTKSKFHSLLYDYLSTHLHRQLRC
jgi:hypothetical protein